MVFVSYFYAFLTLDEIIDNKHKHCPWTPYTNTRQAVTMETQVTSVRCSGDSCASSAPLGNDVGKEGWEKQSTRTPQQEGTAQWKPFCNKPPVKQQVYYE